MSSDINSARGMPTMLNTLLIPKLSEAISCRQYSLLPNS